MSLRLPRHHDADSSTLASTPAHPRRPGVDTVYSVCDGRCVEDVCEGGAHRVPHLLRWPGGGRQHCLNLAAPRSGVRWFPSGVAAVPTGEDGRARRSCVSTLLSSMHSGRTRSLPAPAYCDAQEQSQTVVDDRNALAPTLEKGAGRQIAGIVAILLTYTFVCAGVVYTIEVSRVSLHMQQLELYEAPSSVHAVHPSPGPLVQGWLHQRAAS